MSDMIRFRVARDGWIEYEAEKPAGFDAMDNEDQWTTLLGLSYSAKEMDGEWHSVKIYIGDSDDPL